MTSPISPSVLRSLYRSTLRASLRLPSYNFRAYFLRRTRSVYRSLPFTPVPADLEVLVQDLQLLRRQGSIEHQYEPSLLVVETSHMAERGRLREFLSHTSAGVRQVEGQEKEVEVPQISGKSS